MLKSKDYELHVAELMQSSGVKFGTSGARGLATAMTDEVCYTYTAAFIQHLEVSAGLSKGTAIAVGGDLRPSTERIMCACAAAIEDRGYAVVNGGCLPSPALALHGLLEAIPTVMVTGSHIPDDRNGIKYNTPTGEVVKADEVGIKAQVVTIPGNTMDNDGMLSSSCKLPVLNTDITKNYVARYVDFFGAACLDGYRLGLYEHSTVGRDVLYDIYTALGAKVTRLGRTENFMPVDTEAIRPEDVALAADWAANGDYDSIVSADGDSDRPLISDEHGKWIRGDVAGILCADYLKADAVVTPVSCNSALEKCDRFADIRRTRIGSPFVIAGMIEASAAGANCVIGYEANGGFLLNTAVSKNGKSLRALPTRDAVILHISILLLAREQSKVLSDLVADLPERYTASDRLQEFPTELSQEKIAAFCTGDQAVDFAAIEASFATISGKVAATDQTDGLRITFESKEVIHLRPSGNAPELRCYNEADTEARAVEMNKACLGLMAGWR